jgi:fucose 4-O-acetylase-like acetyltransferase
MKKRVGYFDIAKGMGIILVVIAHIEYMPIEMREYIVTFHMPAFFVISGMLMNLTSEKDRNAKILLIHKLKGIMLPYLVFSVIFPLIELIHSALSGGKYTSDVLLQDLLVGLSTTGISVLWFLPALFFSEILVLAIIKNLKRPLQLAVVALAYILLWRVPYLFPGMGLTMWRIMYCSILVGIGYLLYPLIKKAQEYPLIDLPVAAVLFTALYFTGMQNGIVDLHYIIMGNKLLYYLNATMGSLALILLAVFIDAGYMKPVSRLLQFYGKYSLIIMLTHINFFILYIAERLAFAASNTSPRAKDLIMNLSSLAITMVIETVVILLWERIKKYVILIPVGIRAENTTIKERK